MPRRYLIDGYNLLHAVGLPRRLGLGGLELARQRLLGLLRSRLPDAEITIVFDGTRDSAPQNERGITVLFCRGEADDRILVELAHDSAPKSLVVVSSDHAVQTAARRRQAPVMSTDEFLRELDRKPPPPAAPPEPEKPATDEDTQRWLEAFGEIDRDPEMRAIQDIVPLDRRPIKKKKKP